MMRSNRKDRPNGGARGIPGIGSALFFIWITLWSVGLSAGGKPADIMVVVDLSGSMKSGDGAGRYTALFSWMEDFVKPGDRIGVVAMGEGARLLAPLVDISAFSSDDLKPALRHRERFTDLAAGLENAYYRLNSELKGERERLILLFSDAKIDLPGGEWDARNADRYLLEKLIPSLKADGIRVIAVVPEGLDADFQFLHELTADTGGAYYRGLPDNAAVLRIAQHAVEINETVALGGAKAASIPQNDTSVPSASSAVASNAVLPSGAGSVTTNAPPVVVERVVQQGSPSWLAVIFIVFGVLLLGLFGVVAYLFKRRGTVIESDTELEKMLDDVHSLRRLSSRRRFSNSDIDVESQAAVPEEPPEDPKERFTLDAVSPYLEFEEKTVRPKTSRPNPTDDISVKPAFATDGMKRDDENISLSTMETMLGILPPDIEKHD